MVFANYVLPHMCVTCLLHTYITYHSFKPFDSSQLLYILINISCIVPSKLGKFNFLLGLAPTFRDSSWGLGGSQTLLNHFTILWRTPGSSQCTCVLSTTIPVYLTAFLPLPGWSTNLIHDVCCSTCLLNTLQPSLPICYLISLNLWIMLSILRYYFKHLYERFVLIDISRSHYTDIVSISSSWISIAPLCKTPLIHLNKRQRWLQTIHSYVFCLTIHPSMYSNPIDCVYSIWNRSLSLPRSLGPSGMARQFSPCQ